MEVWTRWCEVSVGILGARGVERGHSVGVFEVVRFVCSVIV